MFKKLLISISIGFALSAAALAQEVDVDKYNINARIDLAASALDAQATLQLSNASDTSKSKLYFRLTKLAKVSQVTVDGASAENETTEDHRTQSLNQVIVTLNNSLAPGGHATVIINYRIQAPEATPIISIYRGEILLLPEAVWCPSPSTAFAIYGPNTAPFTISASASGVSGSFQLVSAGTQAAGAGQFNFTEPLNSLPFLVGGDFSAPTTAEHGGVTIAVYIQPGVTSSATDSRGEAGADGASSANQRGSAGGAVTEQTTRITTEVGRIVDFFTKEFGPPPAGATFNIISSVHAGNFAVVGALILNEQIFRQDSLDASTIGLLADAVSRIWTDGKVKVRGQDSRSAEPGRTALKARSAALLRDSLPRYLSALYIGNRLGQASADETFGAMRAAYSPVAKTHRDSALTIQTLSVGTYGDAVFAKGPLVIRLLGHMIGEDKLMGTIKALISGGSGKIVTLEDLRAALGTDPAVDAWFKQWIDTIVEPDLIIGTAMAGDKPNAQQVNLRNLGTGDVPVSVLAVTASGKRLTASAVVPSDDLASVQIPTTEKITFLEADPDKYIIQTDYDNDSRPVKLSTSTLLNEGIAKFNAKKYGEAETELREAVSQSPDNSLLHSWLGRTLLAENKNEEAGREATAAIKAAFPVASALAWAHITMGQIALASSRPADAAEDLRRAIVEGTEEPAQFAAREALIKAEHAAGNLPAVDESVKTFMAQFDAAARQPTSDKVFALVIKNTLKRFGDDLVLNPAKSWSTEVLRAEHVDANRVAVDVAIKMVSAGKDQSGTALFILYRVNGNWMLEYVRLFNVK
jgi:hypothetical protein